METEAQLKFLRSIGCEKIQGYLISPPVPAAQIENLVQRHTPEQAGGSVTLWQAA